MYLVEASDRLIVNEMRADLGTTVIGREIIVLEQTGSTNDAILRIATSNSKEGVVLFAEHQTEGRGQRGNRWESAAEKAPHLAIAGIGINVNQSPEDFPRELQSRAISLAMALDRQVNRQKFAIALLRNLDRSYRES